MTEKTTIGVADTTTLRTDPTTDTIPSNPSAGHQMTAENHTIKKEKKSLVSRIRKHLSRLVLLGNMFALAWLYACCVITWIPCDVHPRLSLITITFPVALILNLLFVGAWLIVNIRRIWVPILGIALCWGYVMDYYPIHLGSNHSVEGLKIVSWNSKYEGGADRYEDFRNYIKNLDADIICLQESDLSSWAWDDFVNEMKKKGYEYHIRKSLVLFTHMHIEESDTLVYESRSNSSQWYRLTSKTDTIIVVNNHLESNHISAEIKEEYAEVLNNPAYSKAKESGQSILPLMAQSARYRGKQTKALREFLSEHEGQHVIICGDFNDTPISYAYQTLSRQMKNAYRDSGRGIGVSYNQPGFWVRIDHIFFSEEGRSRNTHIDRSVDLSDHYPIISWVDFKQNQQ